MKILGNKRDWQSTRYMEHEIIITISKRDKLGKIQGCCREV